MSTSVVPQTTAELESQCYLPMIKFGCDGWGIIGQMWGWIKPPSTSGAVAVEMIRGGSPVYWVEVGVDEQNRGVIRCHPFNDSPHAGSTDYPPFSPIVLTKPGLNDQAALLASQFLIEALAAKMDNESSHCYLDGQDKGLTHLWLFQFQQQRYLMFFPNNQINADMLKMVFAFGMRGAVGRLKGAYGRAVKDVGDLIDSIERS